MARGCRHIWLDGIDNLSEVNTRIRYRQQRGDERRVFGNPLLGARHKACGDQGCSRYGHISKSRSALHRHGILSPQACQDEVALPPRFAVMRICEFHRLDEFTAIESHDLLTWSNQLLDRGYLSIRGLDIDQRSSRSDQIEDRR